MLTIFLDIIISLVLTSLALQHLARFILGHKSKGAQIQALLSRHYVELDRYVDLLWFVILVYAIYRTWS